MRSLWHDDADTYARVYRALLSRPASSISTPMATLAAVGGRKRKAAAGSDTHKTTPLRHHHAAAARAVSSSSLLSLDVQHGGFTERYLHLVEQQQQRRHAMATPATSTRC